MVHGNRVLLSCCPRRAGPRRWVLRTGSDSFVVGLMRSRRCGGLVGVLAGCVDFVPGDSLVVSGLPGLLCGFVVHPRTRPFLYPL